MEVCTAPDVQDSVEAPAAGPRISVLLLAKDAAVKVLLDHADLLLQPQPTDALRVCLPGHTLILIPEALVIGAEHQAGGSQGHLPDGLEPQFSLGPNGEVLSIQLGTFRADFPEEPTMAPPHPFFHQQPLAPLPGMEPAVDSVVEYPEAAEGPSINPTGAIQQLGLRAPTPSPPRRSRGPCFSLRLHMLQARSDSELQPLPASPSPEVQKPRKSFPGRPPCKARKRLFQD
ncbi:proline-rich protein 23B-like [Suncus etruscus]|uniref:proline-rich protein 23B-like n=1 Tax=Suncus etruscus TaxID=109475 RepID=UPI00211071D7|nr:proline-rich protein 23B-like [Suncus etruscus]